MILRRNAALFIYFTDRALNGHLLQPSSSERYGAGRGRGERRTERKGAWFALLSREMTRCEAQCFMEQAQVSSLPDTYGHRPTMLTIFSYFHSAK